MNTRTHGELANFIWSICNLLRGPYKRNEYRKVILPAHRAPALRLRPRRDTKEAVLAADKLRYTGESANVRRRSCLRGCRGEAGVLQHIADSTSTRLLERPEPDRAEPQPLHPGLLGQRLRDHAALRLRCADRAHGGERNLLYQVVQAVREHRPLAGGASTTCRWATCSRNSSASAPSRRTRKPGSTSRPARSSASWSACCSRPSRTSASEPQVVKTIYDPACGTGGMLSVAEDYLREYNSEANPHRLRAGPGMTTCGRSARSDMLIKGANAENIVRGDSVHPRRLRATARQRAAQQRSTTCSPIRRSVWSGSSRSSTIEQRARHPRLPGALRRRDCRGSTTARCCSCSTCCRRCSPSPRTVRVAAASLSSSTARRCSRVTPAAARAASASGSSRTTGSR